MKIYSSTKKRNITKKNSRDFFCKIMPFIGSALECSGVDIEINNENIRQLRAISVKTVSKHRGVYVTLTKTFTNR